MFHIAAFYRFASVADPEGLRARVHAVAHGEGVKGTVLIAGEGINGTIAGTRGGVESTLTEIRSIDGFEDLTVTWSQAECDPFLRLRVRLKREIVTLGVGHIDVAARTGVRVPPRLWNDLINDPDVVVIDTRNTYEVAVGSFAGAIDPGTGSFREFADWVASNPDLMPETTIAMFCTGGIRCEKASAHLRERGFENVFQLDGGILNYLEEVPAAESSWSGQCFVFDRRVSVGHGLVPGDLETCPNCNTVLDEAARTLDGYVLGVSCGVCHETITPDRVARFSERQRQIELADERGGAHLGRVG